MPHSWQVSKLGHRVGSHFSGFMFVTIAKEHRCDCGVDVTVTFLQASSSHFIIAPCMARVRAHLEKCVKTLLCKLPSCSWCTDCFVNIDAFLGCLCVDVFNEGMLSPRTFTARVACIFECIMAQVRLVWPRSCSCSAELLLRRSLHCRYQQVLLALHLHVPGQLPNVCRPFNRSLGDAINSHLTF